MGVVASSGSYVAVGNSGSTDKDLSSLNKGSYDGIIVKYNALGNVDWKKNYGGTGDDYFNKVTKVSDGYIAVGYSGSTTGDLSGLNKGGTDGIIAKYDLNGNIVWKKNFGGGGTDAIENVLSISDGIIIAGYSNSTDGDLNGLNKGGFDGFIAKYDASGNIVWTKTFGGNGTEHFKSVFTDTSGYIAVGFTNSTTGDLSTLGNKGSYDALIVKYDTSGNVVWAKTYGGTLNDRFHGITSYSNNYIAVGYSNSTNGDLVGLNKGVEDAIAVKYDTSGNVIWKKNYGGSNSDYFSGASSDTDGYVIAGQSLSTNGDIIGYKGPNSDAILVKYDFAGNVVLKKNYGGTGSIGWVNQDAFADIHVYNNKYIITGYSDDISGDFAGLNNGGTDAIIIAVDPDDIN